MKIAVFMLIAAALAFAGIWYVGGIASFDPSKQGREARTKIKPGMTWTKVLDLAGEPQELQTYNFDPNTHERRRAQSAFDRKLIESDIKAGNFKNGFGFHYRFSVDVMYDVEFDPKGIVIGLSDSRGVADLLKR